MKNRKQATRKAQTRKMANRTRTFNGAKHWGYFAMGQTIHKTANVGFTTTLPPGFGAVKRIDHYGCIGDQGV